jgi:hypothetical protein
MWGRGGAMARCKGLMRGGRGLVVGWFAFGLRQEKSSSSTPHPANLKPQLLAAKHHRTIIIGIEIASAVLLLSYACNTCMEAM